MMIKNLSVIVLIASLFTLVNSENWSVQVGPGAKNVFTPAAFDANVGDTVTFSFVGGTHDVTQADEFAKCAKSALPDAFNTPINTGNAATPPTAVWTLAKEGPAYYYCTVADHCATDKMYASINVLAAGKALTTPGVKAPAEAAKAPAQPASPADDLPNNTPKSTSTNAAAPTASQSAPASPKAASSAVRTNNQISIAVLCGTLLSFTTYFL